jgi:hypothetical protein
MSRRASSRFLATRAAAVIAVALATATSVGVADNGGKRSLFLVGTTDTASWQDFAYLAAVPAASHRTGRKPAVLAVEASGRIEREVADYLSRYRPEEVFALGVAPGAKPPKGLKWTLLEADSAEAASRELASRLWVESGRAVICREDEYSSALLASSLAARLGCPLLYCQAQRVAPKTRSALDRLRAKTVLAVGGVPRGGFGRRRKPVFLKDAEEAMGWTTKNGAACDYLAVANPFDRTGTMQRKLSLIAPLLCAARGGLVVPLEYESHWMKRFEAKETSGKPPAGVPLGKEPVHAGTAAIGGKKIGFAIVRRPGGRGGAARGGPLRRIYLDGDGDGKFSGPGEGPFRSADTAGIGGRRYTLVASGPNRRRKEKTVSLKTCTPTAEEIQRRLRNVWRAAGRTPSYLCIVGHPDAIPFWPVLDGPGAETFVESDVPYANADDDPFFEICVGRIIAENASFATLHASRLITYESLLDPRWSHGVGFARWEDSLGPQFANVGICTQYLHTKYDRPETKDPKGRTRRAGTFHAHSPLTRVAAIVHGAHSWFRGLGETYTVDANVLLAPCVVESAGCGTTALHVEHKFVSIVSRLFRNGAVAFNGNAVPAPAPHQELRYAFWQSALGGATLGAANRDALNRKMLTVREGDQLERGGIDRRTLIARHLYGDPAFKMHIPGARREAPARTEVHGNRLVVHGPERWTIAQIRVPEDWKKWADKPLFVLRAPGVYIRAHWCKQEYDLEEIYTDVAFTTRRKVTSIKQESRLPKPLGWRGRYFVDENADGTRTYRWRVRMADFDQVEGKIKAKVGRAEYRIEY